MRAHRFTATLALLTAAAAPWGEPADARTVQPEAGPPFSVQDLVRLARLSETAVSPDGKRVAYTLRTTDMDANKGRTAIWMIETRKRNAAPVRITDVQANSSAPEWSGDGRFLYYLSNRGGSMQVWRIAPGGDPGQVTSLPLDVGSFRVSPKGDRVLVTAEVFADCASLECTKQRLDSTAHDREHGVLYDKVFVRHWDTWSDGRRSQLFSIALDASGSASAMPVNLTAGLDGDVPGKPFGGREDYAISPDGQLAAFSIRAVPAGEPWSTNFDIYVVPAAGGTARNLTADNPAEDEQPAFSPDGARLAYLASDRPGFESDRLHLVLIDLKTNAKRPLTQNWDRSIGSFQWSHDGKTLFATADHLGQHPLWAIDAATGRAAAITGDGEVEGFGVGPKEVFYAWSSLAGPANLYSVGFDGGKPRQLTRLNQEELSARRLGEYQQFNFAGANNDNVFGYVVKPANFKRDQKYPVAFLIHGGPQGSMANVWHWRWNAQAFAGAGYGVVMIDFHGSTGYGQAFTDSISGDWGGKPLEDLKLGLAAALKQFPWLDGEDACALGGSYGGFMINWIAGVWPDRFKCLVSHDGIFDQRSMYYSTEELWFPEWENGGPEYSNPAGYAKFNPVDHVAQWKTPMLVIHGQLDYRVPYTQGLALFTALQRRGVPSEFLYFPDENHWVLKPANSIQWYDTVLAWMNRWTRR
jgi:dipeptidyl aminopeptidase/acylaminoacyl peptidase